MCVHWRCWLGGRKSIWPVKTEWWGAGAVVCLERGADLHMAQLMPLPLTVSCFSKIQIGFIFLVLAHPGGPLPAPHHSVFYRLDALPAAQPTASKHWRQASNRKETTKLNHSYSQFFAERQHIILAVINNTPTVGLADIASIYLFGMEFLRWINCEY